MSGALQSFCENCGARLQPGARFCEECGVPVGAASPPPVSRPVSPEPPPLPIQAAPAARPPSQAPSAGLPMRLLASLLLIAMVAVAWWQRERVSQWMSAGKSDATSMPPVSTSPVEPPPVETPMPDVPPAATPTGLDQPLVTPAPTTASPGTDPAIAAAQDLADMIVWFQKEPWVRALAASMPPGVTVFLDAEPYDEEGWSSVTLRENHAPDSGFDPDVSPSIGMFRVARADRRIEWFDPVSGEYLGLAEFLQSRGLAGTDAGAPPMSSPGSSSGNGTRGIVGGDFETAVPPIPQRDMAVIVADPMNPGNQVARITGPDEMSFTLPVELPEGTPEVAVTLKLLHPESTRLIPFPDSPGPEGIRLRVRLLNELGNSVIRDAIVRPTGMWRDLEFVFYDLPSKVVQLSVEAIWMEGPIYVDEVRFTTP
ncbi:MAG: zinc ribbon domain-containing protein [Verrucomicrobiales bacterium]|nr:zinc ribbon domain-containing protein [Verrucomicrobiales bacterium]